MEYKTKCGCIIIESPPNFRIKYCPKHEAAPDMYEALKKAGEDINWMLNNKKFLNPWVFEYIDKALAKYEGRE